MEDVSLTVRTVFGEDAGQLCEIYAYYVRSTAATFENEPPDAAEFSERIRRTTEKYPYLVIEDEDGVLGFAFAHAFRERPAYDYAAETTIYLRPDVRRRGLGRAIYSALESELKRMGVRNLYACVALPNGEDEFLTMDSPDFHEALGFRRCGTFYNCGCKFGHWYSMIWMEKIIGDFPEAPAPLIPYPEALHGAEKPVSRLSDCDGRRVRLVTVDGEVFIGEASQFPAEYGLHVFGRDEEGLEVGCFSVFASDIESVDLV